MVLRNSLLYLSRQKQLRHWFETSALAWRLTSRFVAGQTLLDGIQVCRKLNDEGILATLDHLGENVTSVAEANESRDACLESIHRIAEGGIRSTISVKPTHLGMDLSQDVCERNLDSLVQAARASSAVVEIDMESSEYVDRTIALVTRLHAEHGSVRAVIQAYLYRSEEDVRALCEKRIPVRLCKGAYHEPPSVAFPEKSQVDENYVRLTRLLLESGTYPAIATHDPAMIESTLADVRRLQLQTDQFEFQMLYGVRRDLQRRLVTDGFLLRLYVPYGDAWYPYFMRRIAERPANLVFLARNLLRQ